MFKKQIPPEKLAVFERRVRWLRDGLTFAKATITQIGEPLNSEHNNIRKKISTELENYDNKFNQLNNQIISCKKGGARYFTIENFQSSFDSLIARFIVELDKLQTTIQQAKSVFPDLDKGILPDIIEEIELCRTCTDEALPYETHLNKKNTLFRKVLSASNQKASNLKLPSVFICYSWTHEANRELVHQIAEDLSYAGFAVRIDIYQNKKGRISFFTSATITHSDYILIMGSTDLKAKYDSYEEGQLDAADNSKSDSDTSYPIVTYELDNIIDRHQRLRNAANIINVLVQGNRDTAFPRRLEDLPSDSTNFANPECYIESMINLIELLEPLSEDVTLKESHAAMVQSLKNWESDHTDETVLFEGQDNNRNIDMSRKSESQNKKSLSEASLETSLCKQAITLPRLEDDFEEFNQLLDAIVAEGSGDIIKVLMQSVNSLRASNESYTPLEQINYLLAAYEIALNSQHEEILLSLEGELKNRFDEILKDISLEKIFLDFVKKGFFRAVRYLTDNCISDVNAQKVLGFTDDDDFTVLEIAGFEKNQGITDLLVTLYCDYKIDVLDIWYVKFEECTTMLHALVYNGDEKLLERMLQYLREKLTPSDFGKFVNCHSKRNYQKNYNSVLLKGETIAHLAVRLGHYECFQILRKFMGEEDFNRASGVKLAEGYGNMVLCTAIENVTSDKFLEGDNFCAELLQNADLKLLSKQQSEGDLAKNNEQIILEKAIENGLYQTTKCLIEVRNISINDLSENAKQYYNTLLEMAFSCFGDNAMHNFVTRNSQQVSSDNEMNLYFNQLRNNHQLILLYLIDNLSLEVLNSNLKSCDFSYLHRAAQFGWDKIVAELLKKGVTNINDNYQSESVLHVLLEWSRNVSAEKLLAIARILIESNQKQVFMRNKKNQLPLHLSILKKSAALVEFLLKEMQSINRHDFIQSLSCCDNEGNTPLHLFLKNYKIRTNEFRLQDSVWKDKRNSIFVQLLEHGTKESIQIKNNVGESPLELAQKASSPFLVKTIQEAIEKKTSFTSISKLHPDVRSDSHTESESIEKSVDDFSVFVRGAPSEPLIEQAKDLALDEVIQDVSDDPVICSSGASAMLSYKKSAPLPITEQSMLAKSDINSQKVLSLSVVAKGNHLGSEQAILSRGKSPVKNDQAFFQAAYNRHWIFLDWLLTQPGFTLEHRDGQGMTPLLVAAWCGQLTLVQGLLNRGASLKAKNQWGRNALLLATYSGHASVVEWLLGLPEFNLEDMDDSDMTPFLLAVWQGHLGLAQALQKKGASLTAKNRFGRNGLLLAAEGGHKILVDWLLTHIEFTLEDKDYQGMTPFLMATAYGHLHLAQALYEKGAAIVVRDKYGRNALLLAVQGGSIALIHWLLKKPQFSKLDRDYNGLNNVLLGVMRGEPKLVMQLVAEGFGSVNDKGHKDRGAVVLASIRGCSDISVDVIQQSRAGLQWLLTQGLCIDERDVFGNSALLLAAMDGNYSQIEWLLCQGANLANKNHAGRNALLLASRMGHQPCVEWLIAQGCSVLDTDTAGNNALMLAAKGGHLLLLEYLLGQHKLKLRSELTRKNAAGQMTVDCAVDAGHLDCARWLISQWPNEESRPVLTSSTQLPSIAERKTGGFLKAIGCTLNRKLQDSKPPEGHSVSSEDIKLMRRIQI